MNTRKCLTRGLVVVVALATLIGCGVLTASRPDFPATAQTTDGRSIFREDVEAIVNDDQLSTDEKREALQELGIEDDDLIEALLTL
ncbi:MAG: hypothetical protein ACYSUQ_08510 [Planctomycetota bacterium]|jgi:NACalpha-BTF3-like transcription factor